MWKTLIDALSNYRGVSEESHRNREDIKELQATHRAFALSTESRLLEHHDAIQQLAFDAQRDRENAARDRADAARDRENLMLRLEVERLRSLLPPPPAPRPELPPGA